MADLNAAERGVLILAKAYPPSLGGVETYSEQLAAAYAGLGFKPVVVTQFKGRVGWEHRGNIRVLNVGAGSQLMVALRMLFMLARHVPRREVGLVHATTWRVALPPILLGFRVPLIVTVHGREVAQAAGYLVGLMGFVFRRVVRAVFISRYSLEACKPYLPPLGRKAVVAWNGISYEREASRAGRKYPAGGVVLFTACQLTVRKNVAQSLRALAILRRRGYKNWSYLVAGDGPERERLKSLAAELGLNDVVSFLGKIEREKLPEFYRRADIFLHPQAHQHDSRDFESFCLVIADAMSFGVPVVAGQDGAPAEYITHGETGFLVDGSSESEIADALETLVSDPELRSQMGRQSRDLALGEFSWRRHAITASTDLIGRRAAITHDSASDNSGSAHG